MLNFLKYHFYRAAGASLMTNYLRLIDELGGDGDFVSKIKETEKLCSWAKNYRVRAKDCAQKAKFYKIQHIRGGHFD